MIADRPQTILAKPADSPHAVELRGVAVGIDEQGRTVVARSNLVALTIAQRSDLAHSLADLLAEALTLTPECVH